MVCMIARITLSGNMQAAMCPTCSGTNGCQGPRPLGPKEIDGLLVSPGKAYTLLSDYWLLNILGPPMYEPAQEKWFNSNHS